MMQIMTTISLQDKPKREASKRLVDALRQLHDDIAEYAKINNLGGFNNHAMQAARAALAETGA